jgi:hypothetical protein
MLDFEFGFTAETVRPKLITQEFKGWLVQQSFARRRSR